jgi:diacylglycerol kinase family enzyme
MTRALLVLNARSGPGCDRQRAGELRQWCEEAGLETRLVLTASVDELYAAIEEGRAEGVELVLAGGGDGTQSAVASRLAGTQLVQGVLPLGTLNHFAKDLGMPLDAQEAIRAIAGGTVRDVDIGEVNGHVFINNSSLGLYPEIVRERELQQLHLGKSKWRALASATLHALQRRHGLAVRIASEDEQQVRRTPFVFIGNNRYTMEGFHIGVRDSVDRGELAVYLGRGRGSWGLAVLAWRALTRRLHQAEDFEMLTGSKFEIATRDARIRVATDGEVTMMETPLRYRIRPRALRVRVPAAA